ncbi:UDP-2,4-diacetamido-2,4,6-trideoxy-beta-L-altropyranose hydrolase [Vibrio mediterranei]|uniref:UDP-2,4-diacetamido-2,4, 6-trideoxy-beta-L-altropyranose hydrolase n=1 Tax=Vibrio mediterranei TaxID=689 RepID=UPI0017ECA9CE|nr:UDP-2,4-diacetamido-2,4,6-trideoxy-beta-L-altropyranose hydrolase [Vibrio mediterranei]NUW73844.1 UDP-2,4-diacetamido-2,4,6-trideoxy-beta-L-altropyranose hydrolase [Vibrio mediterranei]
MKKVVFRTDASIWIGSGHVMRCLVLATSLREHNYQVSFACLPQKGDMISYIQSRGFDVIKLTPPKVPVVPSSDKDYIAWLQRTPEEDANDFLRSVEDAQWVISDHYAIDKVWQKIVRSRQKSLLMSIDDLVRVHSADLIIDQTLGRKASDYQSKGTVLAGSNYALLDEKFSQLHPSGKNRIKPEKAPKVLVSMGGIDAPNASLKVLEALNGEVNASFTVLLSNRSPNYQRLRDWCQGRDKVTHIDFSENMADLMLEHDIAIGAPGSTSWERACLGLPSIVIPLADNQKEICAQLVNQGVALQVNLENIESDLLNTYEQLLTKWTSLHQASLQICDGKGVYRVTEKILELDYENSHCL